MKKVYFFLLTAVAFTTSFGQLMQASIGAGSGAKRYKIYLKADATQTPSNIGTLQFNLGIPDNTSPKPSLAVISTTFGSGWVADTGVAEGGYYNYFITTAASPIAQNVTANAEIEVVEVEFTGGPTSFSVCQVTLPDGGSGPTSGNALFLCTGSYTSNGSNLYFSRAGVTANNQPSYDLVNGNPGTATSTACLGSVSITGMFRTVQNGLWANIATWETSTDGGTTWNPATATPTDASSTIRIRNGHTVTIAAPVSIDETFVEPQGQIIVNDALAVLNQGLTFESNATSAGMIGNSTGSITGDVSVDRFIPARRAWRFMNAPVNASETINQAWQEGAGGNAASNPKAGYGTHITGGSIANGFDQSPLNNPSIKVYNAAADTFVGIASTNLALNLQQGYFLFVRGDRSTNLSAGASAPATTTTLTSTGPVKMGFQSVSANTSGFTVIGNPYVSPIDFAATTKTNVADRFYLWDPKRATVGQWVLFEGSNGYIPLNNGGSYNGANSIVQTGQAFLVEATGSSASVGMNENDKSPTQFNVFRTEDQNVRLKINLHFIDANGNAVLADATEARYDNTYAASVTSEDAGKPNNVDENIAIESGARLLTVERRPLITGNETMQLKLYNIKHTNYRFEIVPANFGAAVITAYLEDAYLNTSTPLSVIATTLVDFTIIPTDAASANPYRFKIVYNVGGTLPVNFTMVKAVRTGAGNTVSWGICNETNIHHYDVEKSVNGVEFVKATEIRASQPNCSAAYRWYDLNPYTAVTYYRIKAVENSPKVIYSEIVSVKTTNQGSIAIYPNPVRKGFYFEMPDAAEVSSGKIKLSLLNTEGQTIDTRTISSEQAVNYYYALTQGISSGTYMLNVYNGNELIHSKRLIVKQ